MSNTEKDQLAELAKEMIRQIRFTLYQRMPLQQKAQKIKLSPYWASVLGLYFLFQRKAMYPIGNSPIVWRPERIKEMKFCDYPLELDSSIEDFEVCIAVTNTD